MKHSFKATRKARFFGYMGVEDLLKRGTAKQKFLALLNEPGTQSIIGMKITTKA